MPQAATLGHITLDSAAAAWVPAFAGTTAG